MGALVSQNLVHGNASVTVDGPGPTSISVQTVRCTEEHCRWKVFVQFDQEVVLKRTLQPQWTQAPFEALQTAFNVTDGTDTLFNVTDVRVDDDYRISMIVSTDSAFVARGGNLDRCKLSYGYWYGQWPQMPLRGVMLPVAQFNFSFPSSPS